jgi:hypothetical protein
MNITIEINMIHKYMKIKMYNLSIETISWKIFKVREFKEIFKAHYLDAVGRKNQMKFIFML